MISTLGEDKEGDVAATKLKLRDRDSQAVNEQRNAHVSRHH